MKCWKNKTINNICKILDNKRVPISKKNRISGIYPYYGASGIVDYIDKYIFDEELVLIGEDGAKWGAFENSAFIVNGKYWVNNHAHILKPNNEILINKFLVYFLNYSNLEKYITGATVKKLNQQKLKQIKIPLPPLKEQERIVGILDESFAKIDESIKILEQDLLNLDELMQSALQKAFNPLKYNAKENYKLPQAWEWKSLDEICEIVMGQSPNGNCIFNKDKNKDLIEFHQGKIAFSDKYINKSDFVTSDIRKIAKKNSVVLSVRAPVGEVNITSEDIAIGRGLCSINGIKINNEFLFFYLLTLKKYFNDNSTGSTFKAISTKIIKETKIPLPPLKEQEQIASHLDELSSHVKNLKQNYQAQIKDLQELKKSLLDKAFKGNL